MTNVEMSCDTAGGSEADYGSHGAASYPGHEVGGLQGPQAVSSGHQMHLHFYPGLTFFTIAILGAFKSSLLHPKGKRSLSSNV